MSAISQPQSNETLVVVEKDGTASTDKIASPQNQSTEKPAPLNDVTLQNGDNGGVDDIVYPDAVTRSLLILGISCSAFLVALDRTMYVLGISWTMKSS